MLLHFTACSANNRETICRELKQLRHLALREVALPPVAPPLAGLQRAERPLAGLLQVQALQVLVLVPPVRAPLVQAQLAPVRLAQARACSVLVLVLVLALALVLVPWLVPARPLLMRRLPHTAPAWRAKESAQGCSRQKVPRRRVR